MAGRHPRVLLNSKALTTLLFAFLTLLQTGCSSVFFYPNNTTYITPDRLELDYENVFLNTPDGETLHGRIKATWVNGHLAWDGKTVSSPQGERLRFI